DLTVKENFTGAMVYHTGEHNIAAGIYVWNGTNWAPVEENCTPLTPAHLLLTGPPFAKQDDDLTFSVSTNTSAICSGDETYKWYTSGLNNDVYAVVAGETASSFTTSFGSVGTYKVMVEVTNRYSGLPATKVKAVEITADGSFPAARLNSNYGIVGETCLDVKKDKPADQDQNVYDDRKDGFPGGNYEKTYKFVHGDAYSDLNLFCDDPAKIVEAITVYPPATAPTGGPAVDGYYEKEFKIKFKSNIKELVPPDGDSLTVKLVASYTDSGNNPKLAYLEIRVEDGTCVCPAKKSATEWLNFMCHNLGGLDILSSSQLVTRAHHGDWYRWGATNVSMENTPANDGRNDGTWDDSDYQTANGDWANDGTPPCPAGWRLPRLDEWNDLMNSEGRTFFSPGGVFASFTRIGASLYFPAAGWRYYDTGALDSRGGIGYYWGSTTSFPTNGYNILLGSQAYKITSYTRQLGLSVRCVQ
ncbi:MAG: hypothetical protein LBP72_10060, partial [Dysgonamonadaceae bacterium]|nr:hypothetical protein [Dysgonamonadaceae bacterium]